MIASRAFACLCGITITIGVAREARAAGRDGECTPERFEKRDERVCAPPPSPHDPSLVTGYDPDRGAYIGTRDGRWELNPYGMVQLRNDSTWSAGEVRQTTFTLHSAKAIFHGHIYDPTLTYHFQLNAGEGRVVAEDVYLRWDPSAELGLFVGQIEVPFNRQHVTLEAYQELIDRSAVDARFSLQRDIGVAAYVSDRAHAVEWTSGVWNGARQDAPNDDASYQLTTRLAWNPFGPIAFREADLADSHHPRLSLAVAGAYNPKRIVTDAAGRATTTRRIAQDVIEATLRWRGLSLSTEGHARRLSDDLGRSRVDYGTFFQAGLFLVPRHVELIVRVGAIAGDLARGEVAREGTIGVSGYLHEHRLKLQADASSLEAFAAPTVHRARAQVQFFF